MAGGFGLQGTVRFSAVSLIQTYAKKQYAIARENSIFSKRETPSGEVFRRTGFRVLMLEANVYLQMYSMAEATVPPDALWVDSVAG